MLKLTLHQWCHEVQCTKGKPDLASCRPLVQHTFVDIDDVVRGHHRLDMSDHSSSSYSNFDKQVSVMETCRSPQSPCGGWRRKSHRSQSRGNFMFYLFIDRIRNYTRLDPTPRSVCWFKGSHRHFVRNYIPVISWLKCNSCSIKYEMKFKTCYRAIVFGFVLRPCLPGIPLVGEIVKPTVAILWLKR